MNAFIVLAVIAVGALVNSQRPPRDQTLPQCFDKVADIFFILDSSSSIYVEDYKQELEFVSQVVTRFDISYDKTRVGALTFSDDYQVGFNLERSQTKGEVLGGLDERSLPYRTGLTHTENAIRFVRSQNFRDDIVKVMVVITDGGSRSPGATRRESDMARAAGFHMVAVGVGQYLDEQEWRSIASDPDNDYVFNITSFNVLNSLVDVLPQRICNYQPIIIGGNCRVDEASDLLFVAAPDGRLSAMDVMRELSDAFNQLDPVDVKYVMDGCQNRTDRGFQGPDGFCNRFDNTRQTDFSMVTQLANLQTLAQNMRSARLVSNQVAVLFVDNRSMQGQNSFELVNRVRDLSSDGLTIVLVDLGVGDSRSFFNNMVNNQQNIVSYNQRDRNSVRNILDRICMGLNPFDQFGTGRISK